ncbi:MAG: inositol monophosphatase [Verrucomicrobia bacterium]|jgi:myo-inositol-1(or 4)-monophosphatase|nr:inositol monophosphatase [Verrucomicrobiota bacterium]
MNCYLQIASDAARAAGDRLLSLRGRAAISQKESSHNLVTQADFEAEEIITQWISQRCEAHTFLCEEGGATGTLQDPHLWVIDPLDATNNYAHGIPHFCISIAYAENGVVRVGVVYDPVRQELFSAVRGGGAFLNGQPIRPTCSNSLEQCIVGTGFFYDRGEMMQHTLDSIGRLFSRNIRGIRRMGSAAIDLCWVACGRFDAFFEYRLAPWDYAAGALIIAEAGGRCADRDGGPLDLSSESVIAANGPVFGAFLDVIRWPGSSKA